MGRVDLELDDEANAASQKVDRFLSCGYNDYMNTATSYEVGSRELKTRLGTYLRQVQAGTTLIVTDRGRPVAELRPLEQRPEGLEGRFQELAARGVVSSEVRQRRPLEWFEPIQSHGGLLSDAVVEDREDRF